VPLVDDKAREILFGATQYAAGAKPA